MAEKLSFMISAVSGSYLACDDVHCQKSSSYLEVPAGVQRDMRLAYLSHTAVLQGLTFDINQY